MRNLSISNIFKESYQFLFDNIGIFVKTSAILILLNATTTYILSKYSGVNPPMSVLFLSAFIELMLAVMFSVTWIRYYLNSDNGISSNAVLNWDKQKTQYLITYLKITLLIIVFVFISLAPTLLTIQIQDSLLGNISKAITLMLLIYIAISSMRLMIALPAVAENKKISISDSLAMTKGYALKIFFINLLILIPVVLLMMVVDMTFENNEIPLSLIMESLVTSLLSFVMYLIQTISMTKIYKQLS